MHDGLHFSRTTKSKSPLHHCWSLLTFVNLYYCDRISPCIHLLCVPCMFGYLLHSLWVAASRHQWHFACRVHGCVLLESYLPAVSFKKQQKGEKDLSLSLRVLSVLILSFVVEEERLRPMEVKEELLELALVSILGPHIGKWNNVNLTQWIWIRFNYVINVKSFVTDNIKLHIGCCLLWSTPHLANHTILTVTDPLLPTCLQLCRCVEKWSSRGVPQWTWQSHYPFLCGLGLLWPATGRGRRQEPSHIQPHQYSVWCEAIDWTQIFRFYCTKRCQITSL